MIAYRYLLRRIKWDYDEAEVWREDRANNAYQLRMMLAPTMVWEPPTESYSYRRGQSISTSDTFLFGPVEVPVTITDPVTGDQVTVMVQTRPPRRDPNEVITVPARPGRWLPAPSEWDRAVLVDWIDRTATVWDPVEGWETPMSLADYVMAASGLEPV